MKKLKIYSSSAGSGKTYTLTKEYLKLALKEDDPAYFKKILAITFTNEAANQMKERVLLVLRQFEAIDELTGNELKKTNVLLNTIVEEINDEYPGAAVTREIIKERAIKTHKKIINDYSEFSIGTIDGFTNRIVGAFTEELNIPYNYEIDLDTKAFLQNSVDRLINRAGLDGPEAQQKLSDTLESFIIEKMDDGDSLLSFPTELEKMGYHLFDETVLEAINSFKSLSLNDFEQIRNDIRLKIKILEKNISNEALLAVNAYKALGLGTDHFKLKSRGIAGFFEKIVNHQNYDFDNLGENNFDEMLQSGDIAHPSFGKMQGLINSLVTDLSLRYNNINLLVGEYHSLKAVYKQLYKVSVLHQLDKELEDLKAEKNIVHLADFNKKIIKIVLNEPVPFIYERLGEKFNHILIDEFQDTSVLQWNNLMPLIENSLGYEHLNLLVGDAKQAIYSWRGGDLMQIVHLSQANTVELAKHDDPLTANLLEQRYETISQHVSPKNLNTNYRSKAEIINFNNDFFKTIINHHADKSEYLLQVYDENFQQALPAGCATGGHIEIDFINKSDDLYAHETYNLETSTYVKNSLFRIKEIIDNALIDGYNYRDIAILCRSNHKSKYVASFLSENNIKVISSDSLLLISSPVIRFLVSFYKVLLRPNDPLSKYECAQLFHINILNSLADESEQEDIDLIINSSGTDNLFKYFEKKNRPLNGQYLLQANLYDLTETLINTFDLFSIPQQSPFLFRFLDVILEFSIKKNSSVVDFIEYWEAKNGKLSINTPKDWDAVTVMTIHKSKGLEYPIVIIAFTDWSLTHKHGDIIWVKLSTLKYRPDILTQSKLGHVGVASDKKLQYSIFRENYLQKQASAFVENLNMIYVAFTRPTDRLYILGADENNIVKPDRKFDTLSLLYTYLNLKNQWNEPSRNYILHEGAQKSAQTKNEKFSDEFILNKTYQSNWNNKFQLSGHEVEGLQTNIAESLDEKLINVLRNIRRPNDIEKQLRKILNEGGISYNEYINMDLQIKNLINSPAVLPFFDEKVNLINQKGILQRNAQNHLKPDRIIVENKILKLIIFSSGPISDNDYLIFENYSYAGIKMGYEKIEKILIGIHTFEISFH